MNAPSLNDDGQDSLRRKQRHSESAKGGLTAISAMLAANKRQQQRRKPGPLDPQRLAAWKFVAFYSFIPCINPNNCIHPLGISMNLKVNAKKIELLIHCNLHGTVNMGELNCNDLK